MKTTTAQTILGTALVAATLALTSCTGGSTPNESPSTSTTTSQSPSATPAPTATSTAVAVPETQEQALKDGLAAVRQFETVLAEVTNAKSTDTARFDAVASGPALQFAKDFATAATKSTTKYSGVSTVTLDSGYASTLVVGSSTFDFGLVDLKACVDSSSVVGVRADGSAAPKPEHPRVINQYIAQYSPNTTSWVVTDVKQDGETAC